MTVSEALFIWTLALVIALLTLLGYRHFDSLEAVSQAEVAAIAGERPRYNVVHRP